VRVLLQRVSRASVSVDGDVVSSIGPGLLLLVGVGRGDPESHVWALAEKIANLRIFSDVDGKMNLSLIDVAGEALVVSQFTLYADVSRGRRPGFTRAALPERAVPLVDRFIERLRAADVPVETGRFGAEMQVELVNDGPFTIVLDSERDLASS
jgi:D-aminoacyl-tRNA deacylase